MQTLKSLFVTFLIFGGAFLAYDYYQAPLKDKVVFKTSPYPIVPVAGKPAAALTEEPLKGTVAIAAAAPMPSAPLSPAPIARSAPKPAVTVSPEPQKDVVPPGIPDVVKATANWTRIPPTAFPRAVKLTAAVAFTGRYGAVNMPAGSPVTVLAANSGMIQVTPNAASPLRTTVPIDSTDLKQSLTASYDAWRAKRIEETRLAAQNRKAVPDMEMASLVATDGRPQQAADGTYPLLMASMRAGQVTEVTPPSIRRWGNVEAGTFNGKPCWNVPVEFDAITAFGKISSQALARVTDGKVTGWYYAGSGEPVP